MEQVLGFGGTDRNLNFKILKQHTIHLILALVEISIERSSIWVFVSDIPRFKFNLFIF